MKLSKKIGNILEYLCVIFLSILFVLLTLQIAGRFLQINAMTWIDETIQFFLGWFVFTGAALLVQRSSHVSVDLLLQKTSGVTKKLVGLVIQLCIVLIGAFMIYSGYQIVVKMFGKLTPVLELPYSLWYSAIPVSGVLIVFFGLIKVIETISAKE